MTGSLRAWPFRFLQQNIDEHEIGNDLTAFRRLQVTRRPECQNFQRSRKVKVLPPSAVEHSGNVEVTFVADAGPDIVPRVFVAGWNDAEKQVSISGVTKPQPKGRSHQIPCLLYDCNCLPILNSRAVQQYEAFSYCQVLVRTT
jgi:hypothetical protein